jgi:L-ribulose-5-phosphate 3-epimerase
MLGRRSFVAAGAGLALGALLRDERAFAATATELPAAESDVQPLYLVSLAQWSLHRAFKSGRLDPLDFAVIAKRDFGIDAVEYVNQFYTRRVRDAEYLRQVKQRADDHGVSSLLIMCDGEGRLGDPDDKARAEAVDNHRKWLDWAKELGCHSIRVNADSSGSREEQHRLAIDGLSRLTQIAAEIGLNVLVENHGGLSSDGAWLAGVVDTVKHPHCGTLPDFGNFTLGKKSDGTLDQYDRYRGVTELMPLARAVSAKSYDFDAHGNETTIDYRRMMKIVVEAGYRKHVGIEYEGERLGEAEGILATKALLERIRDEFARRGEPASRPGETKPGGADGSAPRSP